MESNEREIYPTPELSAILAHEIKNPMNSIIINLEVLKASLSELTLRNETPASQKAKKYLDVIENEIRRLDKVIKGFLDFAHPPQTTRVSFQLNLVVQSTLEFLSNELKLKNVRVSTDLANDLPRVNGSADQIRQALLNLIINSQQAMPEGGQLRVKTFTDQKFVFIEIQDTGSGIPDRIRNLIFNPYFTTKEKGSGLGLTIVRRVMRDHGGDIKIESEVGKGTSFTLCFKVEN